MKGTDLLELLATHRTRIAKHEDEEVSLILIVGPGEIRIESLSIGEGDREVFQRHLLDLIVKKLDGAIPGPVAARPFVTTR